MGGGAVARIEATRRDKEGRDVGRMEEKCPCNLQKPSIDLNSLTTQNIAKYKKIMTKTNKKLNQQK